MERECITFTNQWRALPGMAYGLRQATMQGTLQVIRPAPPDFSSLDKVMGTLLEEALPVDIATAHDATSLVQRLIHAQAAIQRQQKVPVFSPGHVVAMGGSAQENVYTYAIAVPYFLPQASLRTLLWTRRTINRLLAVSNRSDQALPELRLSFENLLTDLRKFSVKGTNTYYFLCSAFDLGIPSSRLTANTFTFGEGARSRWLQSTITDQTSAIAVQLAQSKMTSAEILRQNGLPTPRHEMVASDEQAVLVAEKMGYPVVVKPDDQDQGRGVAAGLRDAVSVSAAYHAAVKFSKNVLVETFHEGQDYRLTTFQGKVVKILHRRAGGVVGNGKDSITKLLWQEQQSEISQRVLRQTGKLRLTLDEEALGLLGEQNLTPEAVPAPDRFVPLRRKSNISAGGVFSLVPLPDCHPDNLQLAVRAADALHLDPCGVDLIIHDIARSWMESEAVIIEMNAKPQLGFFQGPEIYPQILREMIESNGSIPKHLLICHPMVESLTPSALLDLPVVAQHDGLSMSQGVWIKGKRITKAVGNGFQASWILLRDKSVNSAFCVMSAHEVIEQGLPAEHFDRITCLLPPNIAQEDALLLDEIRSRVSGSTQQLDIFQDLESLRS